MSTQAPLKSVVVVLLPIIIISTVILDHPTFQWGSIIATSSGTISTDDEDEDDDDGNNDLSGLEHRSVQPTPNTDEQQKDDSDYNYHIVIPDGAAWKETISERFEPSEVFVPLGSDVTWTNEDDLAHTITSGMEGYGLYEYIQDGTFNSGKLNKGESFSFHFDKIGRYEYFCIPHPWTSGVVIVE
jgi:plastocyanin